MREMGLYKGKCLDCCKFKFGNLAHLDDECLINALSFVNNDIDCHCGDIVYVTPETVCESTGIPDKNKTIIFENDIISAHPDELFPDDEIRLVVEWHDYGWFGKDSKGRYTSLESKWVSELFEVIGNRFDNPELLED